jgi:urea transport system permease protein
LSETFADQWNYLFGGLLVLAIMWAPRGLAGLVADARDGALAWLRRRTGLGRTGPPPTVDAVEIAAEPVEVVSR